MSYIGNTPGVSSQRVVLEEVITGSPKSAFVPQSGYIIGYLDVLVNGVEIDATDFTATDGVTVTLVSAAAVGDTVKIKAWLPRGLSDGYLKSEADARYQAKDSNGNIAVGTTLKAWGSAHKVVQVGPSVSLSSDQVGFYRLFNNLYSDGTNARYMSNGAGSMLLGFNDGFYFYGAASGTAGNAATVNLTASLDGSGNLSPVGNLVMAAGKGIDFSATANSSGSLGGELLDDYETGTWTPTLTFGGSSGSSAGVSYSSQLGSYIKIGRMIYLNCRIALSSKGSGSGAARVTGLPFFPVGGFTGAEMQIGSVWHNGWNNASNYAINIRQDTTANNTFLEFRAYANGSEVPVTESWFNGSSQLNISIVVFSAS
jgi:hypothetical protein